MKRALSWILTLALLFSMTVFSQTAVAEGQTKWLHGIPNFKQYDTQWKNVYIGTKTIQNVGCLVTSMAMSESYRQGKTITPDVMRTKLSFSNNDMYWPSNYSTISNGLNLGKIYETINQGKPCIVGAKNSNGWHWVIVTGYVDLNASNMKSSSFCINDPNSTSRTTLAHFLNAYPNSVTIKTYGGAGKGTSSSASSTKITTGPQATVQKSGSTTAKISWSRVSNAKTYDVELYTAEGYSRMQAGASKAYILKKTGLTGTNYTAMKLQPGQTYVVQVAACNASSWKFGNSVRFTMPNIQRMTIAQLIAKYDVRGYLCVSSNQRAFTTAALNKHDGSWIYTSDFCRILKSSGTSLLVEFPVSGGTKQRWIAADKFFGNFNYAVWSKTATRYIDVTSRAGGGKTFGTVFPDDQVYILQETGSYYQILYPVGAKWHVGYIPKSAL